MRVEFTVVNRVSQTRFIWKFRGNRVYETQVPQQNPKIIKHCTQAKNKDRRRQTETHETNKDKKAKRSNRNPKHEDKKQRKRNLETHENKNQRDLSKETQTTKTKPTN